MANVIVAQLPGYTVLQPGHVSRGTCPGWPHFGADTESVVVAACINSFIRNLDDFWKDMGIKS